MEEVDAPPEPQLLESMRAVGYDLKSAVADIVDNSIAAEAETVAVNFGFDTTPYVYITDDGHGMTAIEASRAMQLAARGVGTLRRPDDLGRFGLGLKTASLSQCRELTLVSLRTGQLSSYRWSLDHIHATRRWSLLALDAEDLAGLPGVDDLLQSGANGTVVVWRQLDRLDLGTDPARELDSLMAGVRLHLALIYHRFLSGERKRIRLYVNGSAVPRIDPFLTTHRATQAGPSEQITIGDSRIELQAFTLPFITKLSSRELDTAQIGGTLRDSQGFYVYRAYRLVIWGTWFGIMPRSDTGKLTRVRVDVPNTLDDLWRLDIKKAAAWPPSVVRRELRRVAQKMVAPSVRAHQYRGRESREAGVTRVWKLVTQDRSFRYELNRDHPVISEVLRHSTLPAAEVDRHLRLIEESFPVDDAFNRLADDGVPAVPDGQHDDHARLAANLWTVFSGTGGLPEDFVSRFLTIEPFLTTRGGRALLMEASRR